ncbi:trypsin-like serine protease [Sorangium sp. So ce145]|uniref:trypsin-like serine protease n=1 Tax=Sorangium sp. So ce145 TaxID=3133285 RepID=UPI003F61FECB
MKLAVDTTGCQRSSARLGGRRPQEGRGGRSLALLGGLAASFLAGCVSGDPEAGWADEDVEGVEELGATDQALVNSRRMGVNTDVVWIGNCSGAIFSRDAIITAAHCFGLQPGAVVQQNVQVKFQSTTDGAWSCVVGTPANDCTASATVRIHPDWDSSNWVRDHDVATIRFSKSFTTGVTGPAWMEAPSNFSTMNGYIYGYGATVQGGPAGRLLMSYLQRGHIVSGDGFHFSGETIGLDGDRGSGACPGDSGGPIVSDASMSEYGVPRHQYALVSWGDCAGVTAGPRVAPNAAFIKGAVPSSRCRTQSFPIVQTGGLTLSKNVFDCF